MKEAIADVVHDGDSLVIDGFTHLICFAAGHEIIRQRKKNLTLVRLTPDLIYDQMIAAGCATKLIFSWAGNPGVGSLHALRRRTEASTPADQRLQLEEYSHFGLLSRFLAGAAGLPFWPLKNYTGCDIARTNDTIKFIACPYTGEQIATVPALRPDVAIIHCQRADKDGNAQVWGLYGSQKESAFAAKRVIVVAEEIVDTSVIRRDPNRTIVPGIIVSHVVHEPFGAHPSYVQGYYDRDNDFYVAWEDISRDENNYQAYLNEFVYGVKDRADYRRKMDANVLAKLKAKSRMSEGVDYGY